MLLLGMSILNSCSKDSVNSVFSPVPDAVDLGLPSGIKWATFNLGASRPEEYGDYYAWGELNTKSDYSEDTYTYHSDPETLPLSADVAHKNLGGKWRMPTLEEFEELIDNCSWTWTSVNGINGYKVQSKKSGYTDKWIFLPAAGRWGGTSLYGVGNRGYYRSSSLDTDDPFNAWYLYFYSGSVDARSLNRHYGQSVRPVTE